MTAKGRSNAEIGKEHLSKLDEWLQAAPSLPGRQGAVNISALAVATGIDRQVLYRKEARVMIERAAAEKGIGMPAHEHRNDPDEVPSWAKQRIKALEEALAVSKAEARDLRAHLRRLEHIERHVVETGRMPR